MTSGKRPLRDQFIAFKTMAAPYFCESKDGRCTFYILVVLTLMNSGVRVVFSYLVRDFYNALEEKDQEKFYEVIIQFMLALLAMTPIAVFYRFQASVCVQLIQICTPYSNVFDPSQPNIFFIFFSHHSIGSIAFTCSGAIAFSRG